MLDSFERFLQGSSRNSLLRLATNVESLVFDSLLEDDIIALTVQTVTICALASAALKRVEVCLFRGASTSEETKAQDVLTNGINAIFANSKG